MRRFDHHARVLFVVWLASGLYLYLRADQGWIPHDEGTLAHSAERVLQGELPHRDYDEPYTGGLALLHAVAFELFGIRLVSLRWMLLLFALAFIPAVYRIAARVTTPLGAGLVTLTCVALSLPNYFASLPSWYNLFFATFGTLALLRHVETDQRRWLFVAGLCGGLSFSVKSIGLYYVAAALLFLLYREQERAPPAADGRRPRAFGVCVTAALLGFAAALMRLVGNNPRPMELLHFALPGVALCGLLIAGEWSRARGGGRWRGLFRLVLPFMGGAAIPGGLLCLPYAVSGSLPALYRGLFVLPQRRLSESVYSLPATPTLIYALPVVALLGLGFLAPGVSRAGLRRVALGLAALVAALLLAAAWPPSFAVEPPFAFSAWSFAVVAALTALLSLALLARRLERPALALPAALFLVGIAGFGGSTGVYGPLFASLRPVVPLVALAACALLGLPRLARGLSSVRRQELLLLATMAALVSLVQFPYSFGVYLGYAAPFVVLGALYVVGSQPLGIRPVHASVLGLYLVFGVAWLNRGSVRACGKEFAREEHATPLGVRRGGLLVSSADAEEYRRLVAGIEERSAAGEFIYAAPDCPHVYFLAARGNPTRTLYDFFDEDFETAPEQRAQRIMTELARHDVRLVIINRLPEFSPLQPELQRRLAAGYSLPPGTACYAILERRDP